MATFPENGTSATPGLFDRELDHHLAALGLRSIEEYVQWCATHGFSVRIEKDWHQRCKERYFALQRQIQARSANKKRESRQPKAVLLKIAEDELAASDLTQPHFVSIAKAFSSLEGDARSSFLRLLLHVQEHANLLLTGPVLRQLGTQAGNTFIDALLDLARHHLHWVRPVEQWKSQTHNSRRQFSSLSRHLLAKYPVPLFMDSVWFKGESPESQRQQQWFRQIGMGMSPRQLNLPVHLTKGMVQHFVRAPSDYTVEAACRWAQVFGLGGNERLVEAVLGSKLATDFRHEEFWCSVICWLIANPMFDAAQVAPIVDYIHHQKFEPQQMATTAGDSEVGPLQPNFSIKGRTPDSILRQMRQWHVDLRKKPEQAQVSWYECGIGELDWTEGMANSGELRRWTIKEIVTRRDLYAEGCEMRHCVASYEHSCATGRSAIWSLGIERNSGRRKRVLTVEFAIHRKAICQVRGKANRLPTEKEMEILRRWAMQEGLAIGDGISAR
jgi:hypothetical protein